MTQDNRPPDVGAMLKTMLASPEEMLIAISGGAPRVIAGRTLDPRIQFLEHQAKAMDRGGFALESARQGARDFAALCAGEPDPRVTIEEIEVPGAEGPLKARWYRPEGQDSRAAPVVWFHQGGGVIGDLDFGHAFCALLAAETKAAVISVSYRLAPEHPWPAGERDALAAYRFIAANAQRFGAGQPGAAVGGDSMGGYFSAVITQAERAAGAPQPVAQLLVYPAVELESKTASMTDFAEAFPLSRAMMEWFMSQYLPAGIGLDDPRLPAPARAPLAGLAPAFVYTAGFDPLSDQGDAYAASLAAAGVPTTHRRYDTLSHSFTAMIGVAPAAEAACRQIAAELAPALRA